MLLEVLESVTFLETFPFVEWHYTEFTNVCSPTLFIVNCTNMALPDWMLHLCMFTLHNFHEDMFCLSPESRPGG
jgi:hypothetical protein